MKKLVMLVGIILGVWGLSEPVFATTEPSAALFEQICTQCHSLNRSFSRTKTKNGWKKTVDRMLKKLDASVLNTTTVRQENAKQIVNYLYSQRGYTNSKTNKAEERKKKLLEKITSSKAHTVTAEEKRKKLLEKFTSSKARTVSPRARTVRHKDAFLPENEK